MAVPAHANTQSNHPLVVPPPVHTGIPAPAGDRPPSVLRPHDEYSPPLHGYLQPSSSGDGWDDDESDSDESEFLKDFESAWEPPVVVLNKENPASGEDQHLEERIEEGGPQTTVEQTLSTDAYFPPGVSDSARRAAEQHVRSQAPAAVVQYNDKYPDRMAGAPTICNARSAENGDNPYAPFRSKVDWEVARWAKLRGAGSTAFSDLLSIDGVRDALQLSYSNTNQLNAIIDKELPARPKFYRREVVVGGESFEFYARDPIECIKELWGDPEFVDDLVFQPERHYSDQDQTVRLYHDMHTGKWWWRTQRAVDSKTSPGGTIVPVIIASDKTQLTTFRNKTAYPVYLTIGNLPKHIRRKPSRQGQVLLAYLPATKLEHITNKAARRRTLANLFHTCMGFILKPLEKDGKDGVKLESADGVVCRCHPILATFVGDYPEQLLVTLIKTGRCPTCPTDCNGCGEPESNLPPRSLGPVLTALNSIKDGGAAFTKACAETGIRPIQHPFWKNLPFLNIYETIAPDILHQLHQGVIKHLIGWLRSIYGDAEIDARCRRLPPNHNIRLFMKGLSPLSRVTGTEHDQIARIIMGLIIDLRLPDNLSNARLLRAVRALLDFLHVSQYPVHSDETLDLLETALLAFHNNKSIFVQLGVRSHFDFPKLHSLGHYRFYIEMFGTTDNYNTAYTERLHIDFAKDAYRSTNCKDEYAQMTAWLDRRERIMQHEKLVKRRLTGWSQHHHTSSTTINRPLPLLVHPRTHKLAQFPSAYGVSLQTLITDYGATNFEAALARFVVLHKNPNCTQHQLETAIHSFNAPNKYSVFNRIKFTARDPYALEVADQVVDSIHVQPARCDKHGAMVPGRFDTALVTLPFTDGQPGDFRSSAVARITGPIVCYTCTIRTSLAEESR